MYIHRFSRSSSGSDMKHRRCLLNVVTGILAALPLLINTETAFARDAALRDLYGVMINVEIDEVLVSEGLSKRQIITDIEMILQETGVKVFSDKEWRKTENHSRLFVQIIGNKVQENWEFFTFAVNVQLQQDVYIRRKGQTELIQASTWSDMKSGHGYRDDIRLHVKELVTIFAADYLAANQKP